LLLIHIPIFVSKMIVPSSAWIEGITKNFETIGIIGNHDIKKTSLTVRFFIKELVTFF